jgi:hypothetical protein
MTDAAMPKPSGFDITPYLAVTSPTRRCGKTLLLTMLYWLSSRGKKNDSMSQAAIYRSVEREKPTLLLDETGWVTDLKDQRQGILCGGFERNGYVEVCEGEGANITVRRFSTYCPKAFGIIGQLTPTLMDRAIEIAMQRKSGEKVERLRRRDNDDHNRLRQQCLRWATDNHAVLSASEPSLPDNLNDRVADFWEPLLAIADRAGGHWPKLAVEAALALSGAETDTEERSVELLRDMCAELDQIELPAMITKTMILALCSDAERPWATWNKNEKPITERQLAWLLRSFRKLGVMSETVHPHETGEPAKAKGYRSARLDEAAEKYLTRANASPAGNGHFESCARANADETVTTNVFSIRTDAPLHGSKKQLETQ